MRRNPAAASGRRTSTPATTTTMFIALSLSLLMLMAFSPPVQAQLVTTFPLRINSGAGPAIGPVVDRNGDTWGTDMYFTTGFFDSTNRCATNAIPGPHCRIRSFNALTNRAPFGYSIPVPDGQYQVALHFVETFYTTAGPYQALPMRRVASYCLLLLLLLLL
jgi:Malectin domain